MTVWVSKGLQYPLVYLPFAFNRHIPSREVVLYHRGDERCLDIGGKSQRGFKQVEARGRQEMAGDDIRLTYVALTRAQSQVVAWWAPSWDEPNGGLSRLLRGREQGEPAVPDQLRARRSTTPPCWRASGSGRRRAGPASRSPRGSRRPRRPTEPGRTDLGVRSFDRGIDLGWRRTSYSGLIRAAEETRGVVDASPRSGTLDDEVDDRPAGGRRARGGRRRRAVPDGRPAGRGDLRLARARRPRDRRPAGSRPPRRADRPRSASSWPGGRSTPASSELAAALVPLHHTPLGPLAPGLTLGDVGRADRLCELDFEIPLAGGDLAARAPRGHASPTSAPLLRRHLAPATPCWRTPTACPAPGWPSSRCAATSPARSTSCCGCPASPAPRYLVVDYKTNRLGDPDRPLTAADYTRDRVTEAMLHSDYPLQALLYVVVVHRYLRWRQPGYDPATHLGGVLYLYVRGMCGPRDPAGRRPPGRGLQLDPARRAGRRPVRPAGREAGDDRDRDRGPARPSARAGRRPGCCGSSTTPRSLEAADVHVAQPVCALAGEPTSRSSSWRSRSPSARSAAGRCAST